MKKITVGKLAPDFTLLDQDGVSHTLSDYRGKWTVVYFYPKDDTPGCTKEACMIAEAWPNFKKLKAQVFGVSVDSVKKHKKFVDKYDLPFTLLADEEKKVVNIYGVWAKKKFVGRVRSRDTASQDLARIFQSKANEKVDKVYSSGTEYMGTLRTSFLVDPQGKIAKIYEGVKPEIHADELLADLKDLQKKTGK